MDAPFLESYVHAASRGRWFCIIGALLLLAGIIGYVGQFLAKQMSTPWYAAALATVGVLLFAIGVWQRPTALRSIGMVAMVAVCAFEWWFLVKFTRLPDYAAESRLGQRIPGFASTFADGQPFTDADLRTGKPAMLTFFPWTLVTGLHDRAQGARKPCGGILQARHASDRRVA